MIDPNPVNNGKSILKLRQAGIKVRVEFLQEELRRANESFIKFITRKMPFVVVKCAQTLDGKIAAASGQSRWVTSRESRDFAHELRNNFDAILVGVNTVLKDDPFLNAARKNIKKIIIDSHLRIPARRNLFKKARPENIILATTSKAPESKRQEFLKKGFQVMVCPQVEGKVDLKWLFKKFAQEEITSILIEGGSKIAGSAFKQGLVDKILFFIAPKILGDEKAISSVRGFHVNDVNQSISLKNVTTRSIGRDILIEGYVG